MTDNDKARVRDTLTAIEKANRPYEYGDPVWSVLTNTEDPAWGHSPFLMTTSCKFG